MLRGIFGKALVAVGSLLLAHQTALAQEVSGPGCSSCTTCQSQQCQTHHCPPCFRWCQEGAPRIKFQHGCPKPICNPCEMPNWGYYQTCWSPWPFPPDYSHCHPSTPAAQLVPGLVMPPAAMMNGPANDKSLPPIRKGGL